MGCVTKAYDGGQGVSRIAAQMDPVEDRSDDIDNRHVRRLALEPHGGQYHDRRDGDHEDEGLETHATPPGAPSYINMV
jgi:hypothetical protein